MSILDLFFPRQVKCIFCGSETDKFGICDECNHNLPYIKGNTCKVCGGEISGKGHVCIECKNKNYSFDKGYSVFNYKDEIVGKINSFKQKSNKHIGETFAWLIADKFSEIKEPIDIIIPVPVSDARFKERGFNQSEVLCKELIHTGKVNPDLLSRTKDTPHQTGLSRVNREENLKESFKVSNKKQLKDKTILLVDDIYTTGSTINACAETLLNAGAGRVVALCLARTPINMESVVKNSQENNNPIAFDNN